MDVSFSAWQHSREESLQLKGESFSFLFDRRYTNRLNRMSRVFFEAYVVATKELATHEDRFPSLSEIDAKMESGAVYAFKDRLVKNTEFFEEVKISGVSYLVPRALRFVDASGTYTDLILNFDEGAVVLPTRKKTPSPPEPISPYPEEINGQKSDAKENALSDAFPAQAEPVKKSEPDKGPEQYLTHTPEPFEEDGAEPEDKEPPETIPVAAPEPKPASSQSNSIATPPRDASKSVSAKKWMGLPPAAVIIGLVALLALAVVGFYLVPNDAGSPSFVLYSAYLSNSRNESHLGLDIENPEELANELEIVLPKNIDRSISARGGIVTISHSDNTLVRMNTSTDASVKIYLDANWTIGNGTTIPLSLNLFEPKDFDTSIEVHGKDYLVTRKNETLVVNFNLTQEGLSFEQSYIRKR